MKPRSFFLKLINQVAKRKDAQTDSSGSKKTGPEQKGA